MMGGAGMGNVMQELQRNPILMQQVQRLMSDPAAMQRAMETIQRNPQLAQMMARMGTRVTIVCRSHLLPRTEPEVAQALTEVLRAEGLAIVDGATYHTARRDGDRAVLTVTVNGAERELTPAPIAASETKNERGVVVSQRSGNEKSSRGGRRKVEGSETPVDRHHTSVPESARVQVRKESLFVVGRARAPVSRADISPRARLTLALVS